MQNEEKSVEEKIKNTIEDLAPFLNMEGGNVEYIKYDRETHTVYVRLLGACAMCVSQNDTLELGLFEAIKDNAPEVESIVNVPL